MFLDQIIDLIMRPFRELWNVIARVRGVQSGALADVRRVQYLGDSARSEVAGMKNIVVAPGQIVPGWGSSQPAAPPPQMAQQQAEKKKMGWSFPWSKKTCPRCQNKLQKSWDQCPYCGQNQNQPVTAGPPGAAPGAPGAAPGYGAPPGGPGYGVSPGAPGYGAPGGAPGYGAPMPSPGGAAKTIAMDAAAIDAPLLATGDTGENVAWLVPLEGAMTGELLQIRTRAIIGTAEGCEIKLFDAAISGRHAEVVLSQGSRFRINDLGSRNGTYVNDKAIASTELVDGDNIRLGRTTFRFKTKH